MTSETALNCTPLKSNHLSQTAALTIYGSIVHIFTKEIKVISSQTNEDLSILYARFRVKSQLY